MFLKRPQYLTLLVLVFLSATAWAKPKVELTMTSEKEVVEKNNGVETVKRVPATDIESGQVLIYTMKYSNTGDEAATNVVVDNPIPKETVYELDSAKGAGSEIKFSINGGKNYKQPSLLTYEIKGSDGKPVRKKASPEQYTHVRWIIATVPPGGSGELSYRVRVK